MYFSIPTITLIETLPITQSSRKQTSLISSSSLGVDYNLITHSSSGQSIVNQPGLRQVKNWVFMLYSISRKNPNSPSSRNLDEWVILA